jgi:hypothetical protein
MKTRSYEMGSRISLIIGDYNYGKSCAEVGHKTYYFVPTLHDQNMISEGRRILSVKMSLHHRTR